MKKTKPIRQIARMLAEKEALALNEETGGEPLTDVASILYLFMIYEYECN
jgi:hypothetical protein